ncbi:MAG: hypothetical protein ACRDRL_08925 [Sciscionella sp.]
MDVAAVLTDRVRDAFCVPCLTLLADLVAAGVRWEATADTLRLCPGRGDVLTVRGRRLRLGAQARVGDIALRGDRIIVCLTIHPPEHAIGYTLYQVFAIRDGRIARVAGYSDARDALAA